MLKALHAQAAEHVKTPRAPESLPCLVRCMFLMKMRMKGSGRMLRRCVVCVCVVCVMCVLCVL